MSDAIISRAYAQKGYLLFENLSGTKGTITLNDSVGNYEFIAVNYYHDENQFMSAIGRKVNHKSMELQSVGYFSETNEIFPRGALIDLNNNTITWKKTLCGESIIGMTNISIGQGIPFYIVSVIGYN